MPVAPSVIVTTYNRPRELGLVLYGLSRQKYLPEEVLIADDGSTRETTELIKAWAKNSKVPIKHVWHEDIGNRKSQVCDKAVNAAKGDYLIFLDGDSIPHPLWVKDHVTAAHEGVVLCGRRVRLGPKVSRVIDEPFIQAGKLENIAGPLLMSALCMDTKRYMLGIRLPGKLARRFHPRERHLMGVNFSLHKRLYQRVGGYSGGGGGIGIFRQKNDAGKMRSWKSGLFMQEFPDFLSSTGQSCITCTTLNVLPMKKSMHKFRLATHVP